MQYNEQYNGFNFGYFWLTGIFCRRWVFWILFLWICVGPCPAIVSVCPATWSASSCPWSGIFFHVSCPLSAISSSYPAILIVFGPFSSSFRGSGLFPFPLRFFSLTRWRRALTPGRHFPHFRPRAFLRARFPAWLHPYPPFSKNKMHRFWRHVICQFKEQIPMFQPSRFCKF